MKYAHSIAAAGALLWLVGCSSAPKTTAQQSAGPALAGRPDAMAEGSLQAHSSRERVPVDLNVEEFVVNNDFGRNVVSYPTVLTDNTSRTQDGQVASHVRNSGN